MVVLFSLCNTTPLFAIPGDLIDNSHGLMFIGLHNCMKGVFASKPATKSLSF